MASRSGFARQAPLLAPTLVLLSAFLAFVRAQDYSLLAAEVLLGCLGLVVAGVACGLLIALRPATLGPLVIALLVTAFMDLHVREASEPLVFALALVGGCLLGSRVATVATAAFGTVLVSTLALPVQSRPAGAVGPRADPAPAAGLPLVVHLILDEQAGLQEFPTDDEEAREAKRRLRAFFEANGFYLFPRAFSQYSSTRYALPHALNFATTFDERLVRPARSGLFEYHMVRNDYFATMRRRGYRLRVYQTDFLDLCPGQSIEPGRCHTYRASSAGVLERVELPTSAKLRVLASMVLNGSTMYRAARRDYAWFRTAPRWAWLALPEWSWDRERAPHAIIAFEILDAVRRELERAGPGEVYVVHLLVPHYPYVYDADCRLVPPEGWLVRKLPPGLHHYANTPESRAERYRRYWAQVACLTRQLDGTLTVLRDRGLLANAVILVHGDHGSRIALSDPLARNAPRMLDQDFTDAFSTLIAVRAPAIAQASDPRPWALAELLGALVATDFSAAPRSPPRATSLYLRLHDRAGVSEHPLRGFLPDPP
jgi:hypothetical protein